MDQQGLFHSQPTQWSLPGAQIEFFEDFISKRDSERLLELLLMEVQWHQAQISMYGKHIPIPRLQAWYGDPQTQYGYSGINMEPLPWTPLLQKIKERTEKACGFQFNSVLINQYRNENDSVDWHADDEAELGPEPVIASVSLGDTRRFELKKKSGGDTHRFLLPSGSLLLMSGQTQLHWLHRVPKETYSCGPRINLTFRRVETSPYTRC